MTLGIAARVAAPTARLTFDVENDLGACRLRSRAMGVRVGDEEIANLRFRTADLIGLLEKLVEGRLPNRADMIMALPKVSCAKRIAPFPPVTM